MKGCGGVLTGTSKNSLQAHRRIFFLPTALPEEPVAVGYDSLRRLACQKNLSALHPAGIIRGSLTPALAESYIRPTDDLHQPLTKLICLEKLKKIKNN